MPAESCSETMAAADIERTGIGSAPDPRKSKFLPDPISIHGRPVLQVIGDCPVDLSKVQSVEFAQNRLRRQTVLEALHNRVERYSGPRHVIAAIARFNVIPGHAEPGLIIAVAMHLAA